MGMRHSGEGTTCITSHKRTIVHGRGHIGRMFSRARRPGLMLIPDLVTAAIGRVWLCIARVSCLHFLRSEHILLRVCLLHSRVLLSAWIARNLSQSLGWPIRGPRSAGRYAQRGRADAAPVGGSAPGAQSSAKAKPTALVVHHHGLAPSTPLGSSLSPSHSQSLLPLPPSLSQLVSPSPISPPFFYRPSLRDSCCLSLPPPLAPLAPYTSPRFPLLSSCPCGSHRFASPCPCDMNPPQSHDHSRRRSWGSSGSPAYAGECQASALS